MTFLNYRSEFLPRTAHKKLPGPQAGLQHGRPTLPCPALPRPCPGLRQDMRSLFLYSLQASQGFPAQPQTCHRLATCSPVPTESPGLSGRLGWLYFMPFFRMGNWAMEVKCPTKAVRAHKSRRAGI